MSGRKHKSAVSPEKTDVDVWPNVSLTWAEQRANDYERTRATVKAHTY